MKESPSGSSFVDRINNAECSAPASAHPVNLPWGPDATLGLELPPGLMEFELDTLWPDLEGSVGDYPAALEGGSMLPRNRRHWSAW